MSFRNYQEEREARMREDEEILHVSPPLQPAVRSGYRVGTDQEDDWAIDIIENSTDRVIAWAVGDTHAEAEERAKMIVACLNRVER